MSEFMKFNPNKESLGDRGAEAHTPELLESYNNSAYAWQPGMEKHLRVSKSSLNAHGWCGYSYKMKYIYRLSEAETDDMVRGTNVHNIVEYFWDYAPDKIDETLSLIDDGKELLAKDLMYSVIPKPPKPYLLGEEEIIQQWFDWQWDRFLVTRGVNWAAKGNEVSAHALIHVEVDGEKYPVHLRGFIDTIFSDGEGGFILMELKTGKWQQKKTAKKMREEMQFYRLMLDEGEFSDWLPVTHWAWEFPRGWANGGDKANWEIEEVGSKITRYAPKTVQNKLKKLVKAHITDSFEPEPFNYTDWKGNVVSSCQFCSFMELCPAWGNNLDSQTEIDMEDIE